MISRNPAPPSCLAALVLAGTLALSAAPAGAAEPTVTSFPANGQASGPITGGFDGRIWTPFTSFETNNALMAFDRATGAQACCGTGSGLVEYFDVTGGPDGRLWAGAAGAVVAHAVVPLSNSLPSPVSISVPDVGTESITDVAPGPDGNVWFTVPSANRVGAAPPAGAAQSYPLAGTAAEGAPVAITTGGDGALWFTKRNPGAIVRMDPATATVTGTFTTGLDQGADPSAIALGPDGNVWFSDAAADRVGRITPAGVITMFPAVKSNDLIAGPDGNLWLAGGSTLSTDGVFTPRNLPADTLAVGADGNVWGVKNPGGVSRLALGGQQFSNPARINVPETGNSGKASLYPSPIAVTGLQGAVTKVTARLNGVHHRFANDLQVMLVGPGGQSTVLMASVTTRTDDPNTVRHSLTGESIAFIAGGREPARRITSGVFSPIDPNLTLNFVDPAPALPSGGLAQFAGTQPNGTWNLFVVDSEGTPLTTGAIAGGWSLDVETTGPPAPPAPPAPLAPPPPAPPAADPTPPVTGQGAPRDTSPPTLRVTGVPKRITVKALRRGLRVRVTPNEPVRLTATVAIRRTPRGKFGRPLLSRTSDVSRATTLRLVPRITGRPQRTFTARVELVATDPVGNRSTTVRTITVRP